MALQSPDVPEAALAGEDPCEGADRRSSDRVQCGVSQTSKVTAECDGADSDKGHMYTRFCSVPVLRKGRRGNLRSISAPSGDAISLSQCNVQFAESVTVHVVQKNSREHLHSITVSLSEMDAAAHTRMVGGPIYRSLNSLCFNVLLPIVSIILVLVTSTLRRCLAVIGVASPSVEKAVCWSESLVPRKSQNGGLRLEEMDMGDDDIFE